MSTTATLARGPRPARTVTDGGLETDLVFHAGVDLPAFAAFPLLERRRGPRAAGGLLPRLRRGRGPRGRGPAAGDADLAGQPATGAPSSGVDAAGLARVNRTAVAFLSELGAGYAARLPDVTVSGPVGPRGDGYVADGAMDPDEAADYHLPQLAAFADAGADLADALTLTTAGEAAGVVRAARRSGCPSPSPSPWRPTAGCPTAACWPTPSRRSTPTAAADCFGVNCAHPQHVLARARASPGAGRPGSAVCAATPRPPATPSWTRPSSWTRATWTCSPPATTRSASRLPWLTVLGGCCGTDVRHVARLWGVDPPG